MRRVFCMSIIGAMAASLLPFPIRAWDGASFVAFGEPIDGLSIVVNQEAETVHARGWNGTDWTTWQELHMENEQDPALRESNLVLFPVPVTRVMFDRAVAKNRVHPIRISRDPATFRIAAGSSVAPHILSRGEWGADDSLLVSTNGTTEPDAAGDNGDAGVGTPSTRQEECRQMYARFPSEFEASAPVTQNAKGETLRWPQQYSPGVRLLVVHHTALKVDGEARSGLERMRALYQYHAQNRGWGDIGYHFIIDERGQIYEGRAGGDSVVGGHVYCNNVGTIGVALMGNFDIEQPTQAQVGSLQRLLDLLVEKYRLDRQRNVMFHGKELPLIVGHRQLVSTDCPGLTMWSALDQVRENVRTGNVDAAVEFPEIVNALPPAIERQGEDDRRIVTGHDGLASLTETVLEGRPGAEVILPVFFRAQRKSYVRNTRIARVTRTNAMQLWQEWDGAFVAVRGDLRIPIARVKEGEGILLRVKVRLPMERGTAALKIGSLNYRFEISGKRVRTRQLINSTSFTQLPENRAPTRLPPATASTGAVREQSPSATTTKTIRILLTPKRDVGGLACDSIRRTTSAGITRVGGYFEEERSFRGTVECRMTDGKPALINELPMESYVAGLIEEPDTEPYEKQRAFAIAARTYATFYLHPTQRKFPGKPYDGSDDPAVFQAYGGYDAEMKNPQWVRAVADTAGSLLTYHGEVIKPPYFSSDDGRTRSPQEAGWKNFPFADIFTSKDDHWCSGMALRGHGVGMSGCGAEMQAHEGKTAEQILQYYYPGTIIDRR